jgi:hypothetical protein
LEDWIKHLRAEDTLAAERVNQAAATDIIDLRALIQARRRQRALFSQY